MYRVIKVLNNNGILVYHVETGKEMILLGNGVGFGKKPTEQIEKLPGVKVYSLVTRRKQESVLKTVNGIRPEFIEATGKIIEEAENVFQKINHEMLLPLADHIALAAKRAKENRQLLNPFTPDIRVLFGEDEAVSQTLDATRIVNEGIAMIEQEFDQKLESGSLGCTRLMSHMYYMILRTRKGEGTNADFNDFIFQNYPRTGEAAKRVCDYMSRQLKQPVAKEEIGFLAIHIQRVISPDTV